MYTLRKISDNIQSNIEVGTNYSVINSETNYEEFSKTFEACFNEKHVADLDEKSDEITKNCYAFVVGSGGTIILPLYRKQENYIMTESGKTFSNLTHK